MNDVLKSKKILFCSHEIGNQMQLMAEGLRDLGYHATAATYNAEWYGYKNDINLDLHLEKNKIKRHLKEIIFTLFSFYNYDIFHYHFGSSLYGIRSLPHMDMPIFRKFGKKLFMHYRGSDIIDKNYYERFKINNRQGPVSFDSKSIHRLSKKKLKIVKNNCNDIFVSTPNMIDLIDSSILIPQIIKMNNNQIINSRIINDNEPIKIVHAPTDRNVKGTKIILNGIERLKDEGFNIDLNIVENTPPNEVIKLFNNAHFGIDQLFSGWYGKVSIELMNLSKPVFCFINDNYRKYLDDSLPIINVNKNNFVDRIRYYISRPKELHSIGKLGRSFVERNHSQAFIAHKLIKQYRNALIK